jgi:hypothetical protein
MDVVNNLGQQMQVPQGGTSQITGNEMLTADKMATRDETATLTAIDGASAEEAEMAFHAGDFLLSTNPSDFADFLSFLEFLDFLNALGNVTFEKL